jgi:hypothetical protein
MRKSLAEMDRFRSWKTTMRRTAPLFLGGALFASALNSGGSVEGGELGAKGSLTANDALPSGTGSDGFESYRLFVDQKLLTTVGLSRLYAGFDLKGPDSNIEIEARVASALDSSSGFRTVVRANSSRVDCQVLCARSSQLIISGPCDHSLLNSQSTVEDRRPWACLHSFVTE